MEDRGKHIDDLFREQLGDYRETPETDVWASLEQRLPASGVAATDQSSKRWLKYLLLLLLLATAGYFVIRKVNKYNSSAERKLLNDNIYQEHVPSSLPTGSAYDHTGDNGTSPKKRFTKQGVEKQATGDDTPPAITGNNNTTAKKQMVNDVSPSNNKSKAFAKAQNGREPGNRKDGRHNSKGFKKTETPHSKRPDKVKKAENAQHQTGTAKADKSNNNDVISDIASITDTDKSQGRDDNDNDVSLKQAGGSSSQNTPNDLPDVNRAKKKSKLQVSSDEPDIVQKQVEVKTNEPGGMAKEQPRKKSANNNKAEKQSFEKNAASDQPAEPIVNREVKAGNKVSNDIKAKRSPIMNKPKIPQNQLPTKTPKQPEQTVKNKVAGNNNDAKKDINKDQNSKENVVAGSGTITEPGTKTEKKQQNNKVETTAVTPPTKANNKLEVNATNKDNTGKTKAPATGKKSASDVTNTKPTNDAAGKVGSKKKEIAVTPETSSGRPINVTSDTASKEPLIVNAATFKKKKPQADVPVTFKKKSKITIEDADHPAAKANKEEGAAAITKSEKIYQPVAEEFKAGGGFENDEFRANRKGADVNSQSANLEVSTKKDTAFSMSMGGGGAGDNSVPLRNFNKLSFEGGIKAGYEKGFGDYNTGGFVLTPFLQWNISSKFSLVLSPAIRYNQVNKTMLNAGQSYYNITSARMDSAHVEIPDTIAGGLFDSLQRNYIYRNVYDSVVLSSSIKTKNYWEFELPLIFRYNIARNLAVYGGPLLTFGNIIQMGVDRLDFTGKQKIDTVKYQAVSIRDTSVPNYPVPPPPGIENYFTYNTPNLSTAPNTTSQNAASNPARFGFMFGFSYELKNRLMIDVLMRQNLSDMKYIPNEQVRKIYTKPYFRITVGYKLFNSEGREKYSDPNEL